MISPWTIYKNKKENSNDKNQNGQQNQHENQDKNQSLEQLLLKGSNNKNNKKTKKNKLKNIKKQQQLHDNQQNQIKLLEEQTQSIIQSPIPNDQMQNTDNKHIYHNNSPTLDYSSSHTNKDQKSLRFTSMQSQILNKYQQDKKLLSSHLQSLKSQQILLNLNKQSEKAQSGLLKSKQFLKNIVPNYNSQSYANNTSKQDDLCYQNNYKLSPSYKNLSSGERLIRDQKNSIFLKMNSTIILKYIKMSLREEEMLEKQIDENITTVLKKINPQMFPRINKSQDLLDKLLKNEQQKMIKREQQNKIQEEHKKAQHYLHLKNKKSKNNSQNSKAKFKIKEQIINIYDLSNETEQIFKKGNKMNKNVLLLKEDLNVSKAGVIKYENSPKNHKQKGKQNIKTNAKEDQINTIKQINQVDQQLISKQSIKQLQKQLNIQNQIPMNSISQSLSNKKQKISAIKSLIQQHIAIKHQQRKQQKIQNSKKSLSIRQQKKAKPIILSNKSSKKSTTSHLLQILTNNIIAKHNQQISSNGSKSNILAQNQKASQAQNSKNIIDKIFSKNSRIKRQFSSIDSKRKQYNNSILDQISILNPERMQSHKTLDLRNEDKLLEHDFLKASQHKKSILYPERNIYQHNQLKQYSSINRKKYKSLISETQLFSLIQGTDLHHHQYQNDNNFILNRESKQRNKTKQQKKVRAVINSSNMQASLIKFSDHNIIRELKSQVDENNRIKQHSANNNN